MFSKVPFFGSEKKTLQASYQKFSTCAVAIHFQMSKTRMRKQTQECLSTGFTIRLFLRVKKRKANKSRLSALLKVIARGGLEPSTHCQFSLKIRGFSDFALITFDYLVIRLIRYSFFNLFCRIFITFVVKIIMVLRTVNRCMPHLLNHKTFINTTVYQFSGIRLSCLMH